MRTTESSTAGMAQPLRSSLTNTKSGCWAFSRAISNVAAKLRILVLRQSLDLLFAWRKLDATLNVLFDDRLRTEHPWPVVSLFRANRIFQDNNYYYNNNNHFTISECATTFGK